MPSESVPAPPELVAALTFDDRDREDLAEALAQRKLNVYLKTLGVLADSYGQDEPELSSRIVGAIEEAARIEADQIIDAYNGAVQVAIDDALEVATSEADFMARIEEWSHARAERSAPIVGITSTYEAHADATLQFFQAAGVDPSFDFGGHGDDAPACVICQALVAGNPWTIEQVIAIGTPHPQCRQEWHPRKLPALPSDYVAGGAGPAGILGGQSLITRTGSRAAAVDYVQRLA